MVTIPAVQAEICARFPPDSSSAGAARRLVSKALADWDDPDLDEVARLLVSELVGNALLHAGGAFDVRIRIRGDVLRVEVQDECPDLPNRKYYPKTSSTGRGLMLVAELSRTWGVDQVNGGKVVWFELDCPPSDTAHNPRYVK